MTAPLVAMPPTIKYQVLDVEFVARRHAMTFSSAGTNRIPRGPLEHGPEVVLLFRIGSEIGVFGAQSWVLGELR
jgi:hypothetical protein